MNADPLVVGMR